MAKGFVADLTTHIYVVDWLIVLYAETIEIYVLQ